MYPVAGASAHPQRVCVADIVAALPKKYAQKYVHPGHRTFMCFF